ncbi:hypothetical protein H8356DRAFT_1629697 [Neocallimastix lanati (nom. inval.)]|jgi:hypothetical protein|nr:hypothetical protein H8356DRAFT_1629697 [Neocallimastix sp. JGI-2020a]
MTKLNKIQKKDMLEELKKQEKLMDMDVLHYKDNDQRRQDGFQKTILAIQSIVNRKLYKAVAPSLEIYFRDVWKISRAQVYRFLDCATVLNTLEGFKERPTKERLCRSLKRHGKSPNNIRNLWTLVKIRASDREITSTLIGKCWEEIVTNGKEINEDPIPKKKECKPRKPKISLTINPSTVVIPSSNPNVISNKTLKSQNQVKTNLVSNINSSFSSPSIITVNNTTTVLPSHKDKINTTSSLETPIMNTSIYQYNNNNNNNSINNNSPNNNNNNLHTPTTTKEHQIPEPIYSSNNENNQKILLQSLPTPTMSSSKTLYQGKGQIPMNTSTTNSMNSTLPSEMNSTSSIKYEQNQNEKKIISSYPSPTASHVISQQVNQYPTNVQTSKYVIKQNVSPLLIQEVNYPMGSVIVNPSPSSTPVVDTAIMDSLPQTNQQVIINDPNGNHGNVIPSNSYPATTLQGLNQSYIPMQQANPSPPQTTSYQIITNPNCILSPTLQQNQQLPIQTTYASIPSYSINQPQASQSVFINNGANGMIDSNNMIYQSNPQKGMIYQSLPNQLPMQPSTVVYTVPPTPDHSIMLSPPSQSPINYYNMTSEYQHGSNYQ